MELIEILKAALKRNEEDIENYTKAGNDVIFLLGKKNMLEIMIDHLEGANDSLVKYAGLEGDEN